MNESAVKMRGENEQTMKAERNCTSCRTQGICLALVSRPPLNGGRFIVVGEPNDGWRFSSVADFDPQAGDLATLLFSFLFYTLLGIIVQFT